MFGIIGFHLFSLEKIYPKRTSLDTGWEINKNLLPHFFMYYIFLVSKTKIKSSRLICLSAKKPQFTNQSWVPGKTMAYVLLLCLVINNRNIYAELFFYVFIGLIVSQWGLIFPPNHLIKFVILFGHITMLLNNVWLKKIPLDFCYWIISSAMPIWIFQHYIFKFSPSGPLISKRVHCNFFATDSTKGFSKGWSFCQCKMYGSIRESRHEYGSCISAWVSLAQCSKKGGKVERGMIILVSNSNIQNKFFSPPKGFFCGGSLLQNHYFLAFEAT